MERVIFQTEDGINVPSVSEDEMREIDRISVEVFNLGILQMMENAGRNLALNVFDMMTKSEGRVTILAGAGGNGGGGICCARHLRNHGIEVNLCFSGQPDELTGVAKKQWRILKASGVQSIDSEHTEEAISGADIVVDALIGYNLLGAPRGRIMELIIFANQLAKRIISLDIPSGINSTDGERPGVYVDSERTLTLALPKSGLRSVTGECYLADIGIPPQVYARLGIKLEPFFGSRYFVRIFPLLE